jgi:hypothetical protein
MRGYLLSGLLMAVAAPALAGPSPSPTLADPYGAGSIVRGHYSGVEQRLQAAYARGDRDVELLLNLAAIRLKERDMASARALYDQVLAQPNIDMATLTGSAWSHDIARRATATAFAAN